MNEKEHMKSEEITWTLLLDLSNSMIQSLERYKPIQLIGSTNDHTMFI